MKSTQVILSVSLVLSSSHLSICQITSNDSAVVVLLGTGMPRPNPEAQGPSTAIVVGTKVFLFDSGPGVERQLAAANLPIDGVTALFITHLHSDHTLGYPNGEKKRIGRLRHSGIKPDDAAPLRRLQRRHQSAS